MQFLFDTKSHRGNKGNSYRKDASQVIVQSHFDVPKSKLAHLGLKASQIIKIGDMVSC